MCETSFSINKNSYIYIYILIDKTKRKSNSILIGFSILRQVSHLILNFVPSKLFSVKIEESKSN